MTTTARKEPRRVRRARRSAAFHAARSAAAATPAEAYQAAEYELRSVAGRTRKRGQVRELRDSLADQVGDVLDRADASAAQRRLYEDKLAARGSEASRLSTALMCLRGAIQLLEDTQRDFAVEHYTAHFRSEAGRLLRGVR